jgi:hypothetical protein
MSAVFYLLDNKHLPELKAMMRKHGDNDLWIWREGGGDEDAMDALINKSVPTVTDQDLHVEQLVVPEGMFIVGVGIAWHEDGKIISRNSDMFRRHTSEHDSLTSLLCLRRDIAEALVPKVNRPKGTQRIGFSLDSSDGYYALRINGLYE